MFKSELDTDIATIFEKLQALKIKVQNNCLGEENLEGMLLQGDQAYLRCLELNFQKLESLFRLDE